MGRPRIIEDKDLLAAARAVFIRDGAAGSTREIADRAGISESALFKRYATKAGLFLAAMAPPSIAAGAIVAKAEAISDPRKALRVLGDSLLDFFRELIPVMLPLIQNPLIGPETVRHHFGESAAERIVQEVADYVQRLRRAGKIAPAADPGAVAALLVAATHSIAQFEIMGMHGGTIPEDGVHAVIDAIWVGMRPDRPTPAIKKRSGR
jgi:AcrR family transcriptional regulator